MRIISIWIMLITMVFISGCEVSAPSIPSDESIIKFFDGNKATLNGVVKLCEDNVAIDGVWVDHAAFFNGIKKPEKTIGAVNEIRKFMLERNMFAVQCNRSNSAGLKFRGVDFTLYSIGISVSGVSKGLSYSTPWAASHSPYRQELIDSGELKKLNDNGWYIFEYH